ncbi:MAG: hypothetical protein Q9196_006358 [Gyalolechia fulgens]
MSKLQSLINDARLEAIHEYFHPVNELPESPKESPGEPPVLFHNQPVNGLRKLPNEIFEKIMHKLHDLNDLHALVAANPQARALYMHNPVATVFELLQQSNAGLQIQRLILASLFLSRLFAECGSMRDYDDIVWLLDHYERKDGPMIKKSMKRFIDDSAPLKFLLDVAKMSKEVTTIENSLVQAITTKAHERASVAGRQGISNVEGTQVKELPVQSLSRMELHRIRRAIWRLRLYFALCHSKSSSLIQAPFFVRLAVPELEEMDCVYHHLQHQPLFLQRNLCRDCGDRALPDTVVNHLDQCDDSDGYDSDECDDSDELSIPRRGFRFQFSRYRTSVSRVATTEDHYLERTLLNPSSATASGFSDLDRLRTEHWLRSPEQVRKATTSVQNRLAASRSPNGLFLGLGLLHVGQRAIARMGAARRHERVCRPIQILD